MVSLREKLRRQIEPYAKRRLRVRLVRAMKRFVTVAGARGIVEGPRAPLHQVPQ